jgi:hypothetical protein
MLDSSADLFRVVPHEAPTLGPGTFVRPFFFSEALKRFSCHLADVTVYRAAFVVGLLRVVASPGYDCACVQEEVEIINHEVEGCFLVVDVLLFLG